MSCPGYPQVVDPDYSPPQEIMSYQDQFNKTYLADGYTMAPGYPQPTFFDTETFFERPDASIGMSTGFQSQPSPSFFSSSLPVTGILAPNPELDLQQMFDPASLEQSSQTLSGVLSKPASIGAVAPACFSPSTQTSSRAPSLFGDAYDQGLSPSASPRLIKRESPSSPTSPEEENILKRPQRKRGRPRIDRSNADDHSIGSSSSAKCQRTSRLPHNQVERKYREGLNSELERLRRAVPTLPQSDEGGVMGQPKPSKAMVLAGAIEYIRRIESERDSLKEENERLKQSRTVERNGRVWRTENGSLDEFLTDP